MTREVKIQQRFSDVDSFRHINNVAQQTYFDIGKAEFYAAALGGVEALVGRRRVITASTATSFLEQVHFEDDLRVRTTVERIGIKSITFFQQLVCGERVLTESRSVMVAFDFEAQQSFPVPDEWRDRLIGEA